MNHPARPSPTDGADYLIEAPFVHIDGTLAGHLATTAINRTHAIHLRRISAPSARSNVPPEHLIEAEQVMVDEPRRFACFEVGGRPADDWLLSQRQIDWLTGAVLLMAVGWVGGVISAVMVL